MAIQIPKFQTTGYTHKQKPHISSNINQTYISVTIPATKVFSNKGIIIKSELSPQIPPYIYYLYTLLLYNYRLNFINFHLDSEGKVQEICNSFYIDTVFESLENIRIILVVSEDMIKVSKSKNFLEALHQFSSKFKNIQILKNKISLVISKSDPFKTP